MSVTISGTDGITTPKDVEIQGTTSGSVMLVVPAVAGSSVITLPAGTGTASIQGVSTNIVSGTAVASTSGTSIDFTGIPAYAKRITVMFSGVSMSGTSSLIIQIGSGSIDTASTYIGSNTSAAGSTVASIALSTSFVVAASPLAANNESGTAILNNLSGNVWSFLSVLGRNDGRADFTGGVKTLSGTLDRVRITTVNGTDTFDAGTVNIMWE